MFYKQKFKTWASYSSSGILIPLPNWHCLPYLPIISTVYINFIALVFENRKSSAVIKINSMINSAYTNRKNSEVIKNNSTIQQSEQYV